MNATNTHTPGPWTTYADSFGCEIQQRLSMGRGEAVARILPETREGDWQANARLIAAAPALLAALERIHANAAESVEWIRRTAHEALRLARGAS